MDLMQFPSWRALRAKLLALQTKAVGTPGYNRNEWADVLAEAEAIARAGVGEPDGAGPDDITTPMARRP
jgi:hypothetical protein